MLHLPLINLVNTDFPVIGVDDGLWETFLLFNKNDFRVLPVVSGDIFLGVLYREEVMAGFHSGKKKSLRQLLAKDVIYLSPEDSIQDAVTAFQAWGLDSIPVVWAGGFFAGMLLREVVSRYVTL